MKEQFDFRNKEFSGEELIKHLENGDIVLHSETPPKTKLSYVLIGVIILLITLIIITI